MIDDDMIDHDPDLDRRLSDLFGGPGLDLAPRTGATGTVLTRVRRVRRRRQAIRVAAVALTVVCGGAVVATQGGRPPEAAPPAVSPNGSDLEIAGTAVGNLHLGMTPAQAEATGLLDPKSRTTDAENPQCQRYEGRSGVLQVAIGSSGVSYIQVSAFIRTPQGLQIGSTFADLHAAYPGTVPAVPDTRQSYRVPVPGAGWYEFQLASSDDSDRAPTAQTRIAGLNLGKEDPSCT
jgi:hypothetical protein